MIRKITPQDVQEVKRLIYICMNKRIKSSALLENHTYVIQFEGKIIGTGGLREGNKIVWLCVAPEFKGRGYAKGLVKFLVSEGATCLTVKKDNISALYLYKSMGFYVTGDKDEQSYIMELIQ